MQNLLQRLNGSSDKTVGIVDSGCSETSEKMKSELMKISCANILNIGIIFVQRCYLGYSTQNMHHSKVIKLCCVREDTVILCCTVTFVIIVLFVVGSIVIHCILIASTAPHNDHVITANVNNTHNYSLETAKRVNIGVLAAENVIESSSSVPAGLQNDCVSLQRLRMKMRKFYDGKERINILQLLNSYLHLFSRSQSVSEYCMDACSMVQCQILRRNFRDREQDRNTKHISMHNNIYDAAALQIMDKIHCHLMHDMTAGHVITDRFNQLDLTSFEKGEYEMYSFGYYFEYYMHTSENEYYETHYNAGIPTDHYIRKVVPKYSSLKDELIENSICKITRIQFDIEFQKAQTYFDSFYRKENFSEIGKDNILSIMVYCNFTILQHHFSQTYRKLDKNESKSAVATRHSHFYYMGKSLKRTINEFGKNSLSPLYHGISRQLIFQYPVFFVYCPLSATSSFPVAVSFADSNAGLVVEFGVNMDRNLAAKCFDCMWLSDFPMEREYLFIQNTSLMQVKNITIMKDAMHFETILCCLNTIESVLSDSELYLSAIDIGKSPVIAEFCEKLIQHELCRNGLPYNSFACLHSYADELTHQYFMNKKHISCNWQLLNTKYTFLRKWICYSEFQFINLDFLCLLFPNMVSISLKWRIILSSEIIEYIINHLTAHHTIKMIRIAVDNRHTPIQALISRFKGKFMMLNYCMYKTNDTELCIKKVNWYSIYYQQSYKHVWKPQKRFQVSDVAEENKCMVEFDDIVSALKMFTAVTNGNTSNVILSVETQVLLRDIIRHQLSKKLPSKYKSLNTLDASSKNLVALHFQNKRRLMMDYLNKSKQQLLFECLFNDHCEWIKLDYIRMLFPKIELVTVENIDMCSQIFDDILVHLTHQTISYRIGITAGTDSTLSASTVVQKYVEQFDSMGFRMKLGEWNAKWLWITPYETDI